MKNEQSASSAGDLSLADKKPATPASIQKTDWDFYLKVGLVAIAVCIIVYFYIMIFQPRSLPLTYVGVACMIPIMLTVVSSNKPWYVGSLVYIASSVAVVCLLYGVGDFILPDWATVSSGRGRSYHKDDATGSWMAGFAGFVLSLFGIIGAGVMLSEAIKEYRKKRNPTPDSTEHKSNLPQ